VKTLKINGIQHQLDVEDEMPLLWVLRDELGMTGTKFGCGLSTDGKHPVQQAWLEEQVPQCGYCQSGQIMTAAALLQNNPQPGEEEIEQQMTNLCRCATYVRIKRGIRRSAEIMQKKGN